MSLYSELDVLSVRPSSHCNNNFIISFSKPRFDRVFEILALRDCHKYVSIKISIDQEQIYIVEDLIQDSCRFDVHSPEDMPGNRYFTSQFDNKSS